MLRSVLQITRGSLGGGERNVVIATTMTAEARPECFLGALYYSKHLAEPNLLNLYRNLIHTG